MASSSSKKKRPSARPNSLAELSDRLIHTARLQSSAPPVVSERFHHYDRLNYRPWRYPEVEPFEAPAVARYVTVAGGVTSLAWQLYHEMLEKAAAAQAGALAGGAMATAGATAPLRRIGVQVAGNSGRPGGACGHWDGNVRSIHGRHTTQEEAVVSNWLATECGRGSGPRQWSALFRDTIWNRWGLSSPGEETTDPSTLQGVNYRDTTKSADYCDVWVVRSAYVSAMFDANDGDDHESDGRKRGAAEDAVVVATSPSKSLAISHRRSLGVKHRCRRGGGGSSRGRGGGGRGGGGGAATEAAAAASRAFDCRRRAPCTLVFTAGPNAGCRLSPTGSTARTLNRFAAGTEAVPSWTELQLARVTKESQESGFHDNYDFASPSHPSVDVSDIARRHFFGERQPSSPRRAAAAAAAAAAASASSPGQKPRTLTPDSVGSGRSGRRPMTDPSSPGSSSSSRSGGSPNAESGGGGRSPYAFFRDSLKHAMRASLDAMMREGCEIALLARISCGIYAGQHRQRINDEFLDIVNELLAEPIGTLADETGEPIGTSTRGHYFEQVLIPLIPGS